MANWYINEMSKLSGVSVRMLRHYDKIGLLTPSMREDNGYRCYAKEDLNRLEQIIALRYLGFGLKEIKAILAKNHGLLAHLKSQQQILKKQKEQLSSVLDALEHALTSLTSSSSPDWKTMTTLIRSYTMNEHLREKLENSWAGKHLPAEQFEALLFLYEQFPSEFQAREQLIEEINQGRLGSYDSAKAKKAVCFLNDFAKKTKSHFSEQVKLGTGILKSIQAGQIAELEINDEGMLWLGKAMTHYWLSRWNGLYEKIENSTQLPYDGPEANAIVTEWKTLVDEVLAKGNKTFLTGMLLWQETARQAHELKESKSPSQPKELIKPYHIQLFFNPDAANWISLAIEHHT